MSTIPDDNRKMRLTTPLGEGGLFLTKLTGQEEISGLFSFELNVKSPRRNPVSFDDLIGKDIRVDMELPSASFAQALTSGKLPQLKTRRFCGLVQEISDLYRDASYCYYRLTMKPRFWLWTQKSDCRIFQEQKVGDILTTVLEGLNVDLRLCDNYVSRPYCVQYNESTFDFVTRLMAEEGMFYFFEHQYDGQDDEHRQRGERLVVTDSVVNLPSILAADVAGGAGANPKATGRAVVQLPFDDVSGGNRSELAVYKWHRTQQLVSTKCTLRDHSFQLPGQSLEADEELPQQIEIGEHVHQLAPVEHEMEVYEYPGQYAKQFDGITPGGGERPDSMKRVFKQNSQFAKREIERHATKSVRIEGESDCPHLIPGHKFSLLRERVASGPFLIKAVEHHAELNADFRAGEAANIDPKLRSEHRYSNSFLCQAEIQPFQAARKPRPTISGFQTATVVGPEGEEVFSDKFGRIKVQFHWDRHGKNDADSSCWIRVSQVWAGNRWGAFFWPRVGHEVVVSFEDGDPDRPLIVGSVYNAKNMPPMELPQRSFSSGIKSCSIGGNPIENFSCVIFHDGPGQEYLQLHSETHECLTSETSKLNYSTGPSVDFQGRSNKILGMLGSGSGGGPTSDEVQSAGKLELPGLEDSADDFGEKLKSVLESFGLQGRAETGVGSGSGGFISEVMELNKFKFRGESAGEDADQAGVGNSAGSLKMISGDSVTTKLGASFEHCFNPNMKMTADIEEMVRDFIAQLMLGSPGVGREALFATVWGAGGFLNQVYGNQQVITYGRSLAVKRGEQTSVTQPHFFASPSVGCHSYGVAISQGVATAIRCLAILILLLDIAMAIAIKWKMETPPKKKSHEN